MKCVNELKILVLVTLAVDVVGIGAHGDLIPIDVRLKIELRGVDDAVVREESKLKDGGLGIEADQGQRVVGPIIFQLHLLDGAAFAAEGDLLEVGLIGKQLFLAHGS